MNKVELSKEHKKQAIDDIKKYFAQERDEDLGDLSAEMILDFINEKIGVHHYNQAITDVQKYMSERVDELYSLLITPKDK